METSIFTGMDTLLHQFIFSTLVGECEYYCIEMKVGVNYIVAGYASLPQSNPCGLFWRRVNVAPYGNTKRSSLGKGLPTQQKTPSSKVAIKCQF